VNTDLAGAAWRGTAPSEFLEDYGRDVLLISAKPALASDDEMGSISLYRNAQREGVTAGSN
jgi:hypothetical protein